MIKRLNMKPIVYNPDIRKCSKLVLSFSVNVSPCKFAAAYYYKLMFLWNNIEF